MIPVCLTRTFGTMVGNPRQGTVLVAVMGVIWAALLAVAWCAETHPNGPAALAAGAAMEGKEVRFGDPGLGRCSRVSTTGTSTGAVNSLHDSYTGGAGGITLLNMLLGEVAPGGVGTGPLRHPRARDHRGVPGRADGRPHPGVPGQEARAAWRSPPRRSSILAMPALVLLGAGAGDRAARHAATR